MFISRGQKTGMVTVRRPQHLKKVQTKIGYLNIDFKSFPMTLDSKKS